MEETETATFSAHEAQADAANARQDMQRLEREAQAARDTAAAAEAALDGVKAEAAKAQGLAERHQQAGPRTWPDRADLGRPVTASEGPGWQLPNRPLPLVSCRTDHQVVAKLTADNLVFLMQLKKAEADLAAANKERAALKLAAEQQRGPWFDQVEGGLGRCADPSRLVTGAAVHVWVAARRGRLAGPRLRTM
jgi:hypothetical protein